MDSGRWALAALVGLMLFSLVWLVDRHFDAMWDAVLYVLTTRSLLAGDGYAVYGEPFHLRPPGFSVLLLPVMAVFGNDFLAFNVFVSLLGILALALVFVYFRPRLGVPVSFAACASIWVNPQYQSICNTVVSDTAGLAAIFACLLVDRWARQRAGLGRDVVLGLALAATGYLRTVTTFLLPALVVSRLIDRESEAGAERFLRGKLPRLAVVCLVPIVLGIPWSMWKSANPPPQPARQHGIYSYWTAQWHQDSSDPDSPLLSAGDVLGRVPWRTEQCFTSLGSRLPKVTLHGIVPAPEVRRIREENRRPFGFWLGCVGVASLVVVAVRRRDTGSFFALGSLGILLIYFDFDDRLLVPNYVFVLGATLELLLLGVRKFLPPGKAAAAVTVLVAVMGIADAHPPEDREFVAQRSRVNTAVAAFIDETYAEDVPVGGSLGHHMAPFLERPVYFLEVAAMKQGAAGIRDVVRERKLRVIIDTGGENGGLRQLLDRTIVRNTSLVRRFGDVAVYELR